EVQAGFLSRVERGRPFLTLKLALSLDGRIATAGGESRWITGEAARKHVHSQRLMHDAVMVGGGTARADLPSLNVRNMGRPPRQPVRIILSSRDLPDLPPDGPDHGPLWQFSGDLCEVMAQIAGRGVTRIYCEGG